MTLSVRHLYSIDGRDASDFSTDPNPNRNGSTVLDPNSVYALDSLGTPPICQNHSSCNEDDYDRTSNPPSIHSCALEFDVPDPTRIAVALLSILSVSADWTGDPREREIVREREKSSERERNRPSGDGLACTALANSSREDRSLRVMDKNVVE